MATSKFVKDEFNLNIPIIIVLISIRSRKMGKVANRTRGQKLDISTLEKRRKEGPVLRAIGRDAMPVSLQEALMPADKVCRFTSLGGTKADDPLLLKKDRQ